MGNKKVEERQFSEREIKLAEMRNGRIERKYLQDLVMEYKFKKQLDKKYSMPRELAEVVIIIVDKMLGSPSWRRYSDDWKEEFRGRAIEHVLKYAHNFNPKKCKSGKNDPYNYFAMIIGNAFIQSWRKCKAYSDNTIMLNPDMLYAQSPDSPDFNPELTPEDNKWANMPEIGNLDWGKKI